MRLRAICIGGVVLVVIAISSITNAALAPEFRWDEVCKPNPERAKYPVAPGGSDPNCRPVGFDYYAIGAPADADLTLENYNVSVFCNLSCDFSSRYKIVSPRAQRVLLTIFSGLPNTLKIELSNHTIIAGAARKPEAKDFKRHGVLLDSVDPTLSAVDVSLPLVMGVNELAISEGVLMGTRGRGTARVFRVVRSRFSLLQGWSKTDDFSFLMNFGFVQSAVSKSDGLKEPRVESLCVAFSAKGDESEVPLVGYQDNQTGRPIYPMLYRFELPDFLTCWLGGRSALRDRR
jgi:hypothetical protein